MAIVRKEKFIFVETNENHNKVWYIEEHDNNSIRTEWGRVGNNMAESTKSFSDKYTTSKEYDKLVKSKLKKVETLNGQMKDFNEFATLLNQAFVNYKPKKKEQKDAVNRITEVINNFNI